MDENGNSGTNPHTPAPLDADCLEIYETGDTLLTTLVYPLFTPFAKPVVGKEAEELFCCTASGADGRGQYTEEGFVVLKGSKGRVKSVPSFAGTSWDQLRGRLIESGEMRQEGNTLILAKDILFSNPIKAAALLMGRSANGWTEWKQRGWQDARCSEEEEHLNDHAS